MVYTSQRLDYGTETQTTAVDVELPVLLDPSVLRAARQIYSCFYDVHPDYVKRPFGVAIDRNTLRGKLIFSGKPILLPQECFVPINRIESEVY